MGLSKLKDFLRENLAKELEEEIETRMRPILNSLKEIENIQREQLKILKSIKKLLEAKSSV